MTLELRVLRGAAPGRSQRFEQELVTLGRHPESDFRFDPGQDLDVSARHAEIRRQQDGGAWMVRDAGSTNGTFVNGRRIAADTPLRDGDVVALGAHGPQIEVRGAGGVQHAGADAATRRRRVGIALAAVAVALAAAGAWAFARSRPVAPPSPAPATQQGGGAATATEQDGTVAPSWVAVGADNGAAIAMIAAELGGRPYGGTAFGVAPSGLLVTNKHLVADGTRRATRVVVKFAETRAWLPARVVAVSPSDDAALIQVEAPGRYPAVRAVAGARGPAVGAPVATIGYPLGADAAMEGEGDDAVAKSSLTTGTVSKRLPDLLQIDGFAAHGSSGSPVFDLDGRVVGIVWGGPRGTAGRIVYAVPSERLVPLLPADARGIVR